jgi:PAS domain S-box-containing protein
MRPPRPPSLAISSIAFLAVPAVATALVTARRRRRRQRRLLEEQALVTERERVFLMNIIEHAPVGLAAVDRQLRFLWTNAAFAETKGGTPDDFVGRHFRDVFSDEDELLAKAFLEAAEKGIRVHFSEIPHQSDTDGPVQYWDVTGVPLVQGQGLDGLLMITHNVTSRVEQLQKLQEVDRLKDHFLSTISHELKTPLSLIIGYGELLEDKYPNEALLQGVMDGSRRLVEHLNAVIDYSALLSDSLPLYPSQVCLEEVAAQAAEMMAEEFKRKSQHFHLEVAPGTPVIRGDIKRITQMLIELLDNAHKMTPPFGHLGLEIGPDGEHGEAVRLTVWDTGRGIAPDKFPAIWQAFSQLESEDAHRHGGLGLGLTIVKALTDLHHGCTEVESHPGKGCRFTIYLPVATE